MKKLIFFLLISTISIFSFSQETKSTFGTNNTYFIHSYVGFGFMSPPKYGEGADIIYGKSNSFIYGIKYKLKVSNVISFGIGINYNYQAWKLKQTNNKKIPVNTLYDKEKIIINNIGGEFFIRFNVGKRDSSIGNYIDISPYGEWAYRSARETKLNSSNGTVLGEDYNVTTNVNLNYIEKINYGLQLKFALGRIALVGKYRLSDLFTEDFKSSISKTELPRLIIGIELGLHE